MRDICSSFKVIGVRAIAFATVLSLFFPALTFAQLAPTIETSLDSLDPVEPFGFSQSATFVFGDETPTEWSILFDRGSFDFTGYEVDDVLATGGGAVEVPIPGTFGGSATATASFEIVIMEIDDVEEIVQGDVFLRVGAGEWGTIDEVVYTVTFETLADGAEITFTDVDLLDVWSQSSDVELDWEFPAIYDAGPTSGTLNVVTTISSAITTFANIEEFELVASAVGPLFIRGDVDGNGSVSALLDSLYLLDWAFNGGASVPCEDAADVDGNNTLSALLDSLALLDWAFNGGDVPPDPGPTRCGPDSDDDDIECETAPDSC